MDSGKCIELISQLPTNNNHACNQIIGSNYISERHISHSPTIMQIIQNLEIKYITEALFTMN